MTSKLKIFLRSTEKLLAATRVNGRMFNVN
jgi:hypothetical protein